MKKQKKIISILLMVMLMLMQVLPVSASENNTDEWYELVEEEFEMSESMGQEITPYTLYIMDVVTSLVKISSGKVGLRAFFIKKKLYPLAHFICKNIQDHHGKMLLVP